MPEGQCKNFLVVARALELGMSAPFLKNIWDSGLGLLLVVLGRACVVCMYLYRKDTVSSVLMGKAGTEAWTRPGSSF